MRLDKFIANSTVFTRSRTKSIIRSGKIKVDGVITKSAGQKINDDSIVEYMNVVIATYQCTIRDYTVEDLYLKKHL